MATGGKRSVPSNGATKKRLKVDDADDDDECLVCQKKFWLRAPCCRKRICSHCWDRLIDNQPEGDLPCPHCRTPLTYDALNETLTRLPPGAQMRRRNAPPLDLDNEPEIIMLDNNDDGPAGANHHISEQMLRTLLANMQEANAAYQTANNSLLPETPRQSSVGLFSILQQQLLGRRNRTELNLPLLTPESVVTFKDFLTDMIDCHVRLACVFDANVLDSNRYRRDLADIVSLTYDRAVDYARIFRGLEIPPNEAAYMATHVDEAQTLLANYRNMLLVVSVQIRRFQASVPLTLQHLSGETRAALRHTLNLLYTSFWVKFLEIFVERHRREIDMQRIEQARGGAIVKKKPAVCQNRINKTRSGKQM